jgi:hypothetical protein
LSKILIAKKDTMYVSSRIWVPEKNIGLLRRI